MDRKTEYCWISFKALKPIGFNALKDKDYFTLNFTTPVGETAIYVPGVRAVVDIRGAEAVTLATGLPPRSYTVTLSPVSRPPIIMLSPFCRTLSMDSGIVTAPTPEGSGV